MEFNFRRLLETGIRFVMLGMAVLSIVSCNQKGGSLVDSLVGIKGSLLDGGGVGNDSLTFSPNPLDFGNVAVGAPTSVATVSVMNSGKVAIKILSMTSPSDNTDLTIANDGTCAVGLDLDINATCTLRLQYTPSVAGKFQSKVAFEFAPSVEISKVYTNQANVIGNAVAPLAFDGIQPIITNEVSTTKVTVHWTPIEGASAYVISQNDNGTILSMGSAAATDSSFTLTGLAPNTNYNFRVNVLNILGIPDHNQHDETAITDPLGQFAPVPNLATAEGVTGTSSNLASFCTDVESNTPQLMLINSQSDPDLHCSMLTSPYRVSCTPGFKDGATNWQGTVDIKCLLNDYPTPYSQTLTVNVSNIFRPPTLATINGQSATAGQPITDIQAAATSTDETAFTYTCLYDQSIDGTVAGTAANCNTLPGLGGTNASFTSGTVKTFKAESVVFQRPPKPVTKSFRVA